MLERFRNGEKFTIVERVQKGKKSIVAYIHLDSGKKMNPQAQIHTSTHPAVTSARFVSISNLDLRYRVKRGANIFHR